jgi:hypothetical protein
MSVPGAGAIRFYPTEQIKVNWPRGGGNRSRPPPGRLKKEKGGRDGRTGGGNYF